MSGRASRVAASLARRAARAALPRLGRGVTEVGEDAWLFQPPGRAWDVAGAGPGRLLLTDPAVAAPLGTSEHRKGEKAITRALVTDHVAGVLALYRVDCVLDVGANRGQFAKSLRRAGYRGRIVSFEPLPTAYRHLERAAAGDGAWTTHQLALGREDASVVIGHRPSHSGMSSLLPPSEFGARYKAFEQEVRVDARMRRLDDVLAEVAGERGRLYLKMDTQGYDTEVFAGLGDRARDVVALQSELAFVPMYEGMARACEALATYEDAGFEVSGIYPVRREYRTARLIECDCIMVRAAAA